MHFGRQSGQRVKAYEHQKRALELVAAGQSYREVGLRLGISKNTVLDIVSATGQNKQRLQAEV
jgi:putative DNA-invertase from lambdoid prophage Rac